MIELAAALLLSAPAPPDTSFAREVERIRSERADSIRVLADRHDAPPKVAAVVLDAALATGTPPDLAFRLVRVESSFRPGVVSHAGAVGLAQVMPATAWAFCADLDVYRPRGNVICGLRYLRHLRERFTLREALAAYNAGPSRRQYGRQYAALVLSD